MLIDRIGKLKAGFAEEFDGHVIANEINMLYLTGFLGAAVMFVPNEGESILYVYGVNYEGARTKAKNCRVERVKRDGEAFKKLADQIKAMKLKTLCFDSMSFQVYQKFKNALEKSVSLEGKSEYIWSLRRIKDDEELKRMRKAAELTAAGMQRTCDVVKPGIKEIEVAAEIEYEMRKYGSYGVAFDTIVASGPHSAYPHGGCCERRLAKGDLVVIDIGATYMNYRSDMTRTVVIGKASRKQKKIYDVVKEAQEAAFQRIRDGVKAARPDADARSLIEEAGYGDYFVHGLGHGVGLEVHEQPVLNTSSKDILKSGNVVTDEPGVYIVGFGGFRIEDTILVRKGKAERLTKGLYVLET